MRKLILMIIVLFVSLAIVGCGGKSKESEVVEKGSLSQTFKLIDASGRDSGTLKLNAMGGAELRDADGNLIGTFTSGTASEPVVEKASEVSVEEKSSDKDEDTE